MTLERAAIRDQAKDWRAYRSELEARNAELLKERPADFNAISKIGMSPKEVEAYSLTRAIRWHMGEATDKEAGREAEAQREIQKQIGSHRPDCLHIPYELLTQRSINRAQNAEVRRTLTGVTDVLGGSYISQPNVPSEYISTLRDMAQVIQAGVQVINIDREQIKIPRKTGDAAFSFKAYNSPTGDTDIASDSLSLEMKTASGGVSIGREALKLSNPSLDGTPSSLRTWRMARR